MWLVLAGLGAFPYAIRVRDLVAGRLVVPPSIPSFALDSFSERPPYGAGRQFPGARAKSRDGADAPNGQRVVPPSAVLPRARMLPRPCGAGTSRSSALGLTLLLAGTVVAWLGRRRGLGSAFSGRRESRPSLRIWASERGPYPFLPSRPVPLSTSCPCRLTTLVPA